ncbi:MAG: NADH-quinone oxidoreductase subunit J [Candidatus Eremiobacteraeota bacterium]|nr:NADH-quinone oxidoreductase subunit J [Candidatus Eremiobacteraeota bacterium]
MIAFWILAIVLVASAVFTVSGQKPVYSVVGLLVNFVALAALYLTLQAEFLAVMQIVVYSGAILILFVFVIALLSSGVRPFSVGPNRMPRALYPAVALGVLALAGIVAAPIRTAIASRPPSGAVGEANVFGSVADFGSALFYRNLLPFEVTAFILMVAVVGVVLIAGDEGPAGVVRRKRRRPGEREPIVKPEAASR